MLVAVICEILLTPFQLTANRRAKIADLGTALVVLPHLKKHNSVSEGRWKAPEIMYGYSQYTPVPNSH